jgi:hypothetical protein
MTAYQIFLIVAGLAMIIVGLWSVITVTRTLADEARHPSMTQSWRREGVFYIALGIALSCLGAIGLIVGVVS